MDRTIKQAYDPEFFRTQGHKLIDLLTDYLKECHINPDSMPVLPYKPPEEMLSIWEKDFSQSPSRDGGHFFSQVIEQSLHTHHPQCMGHQVSPVFPLAALSDFLASFLDCGTGVYENGSPSVVMERIIIKKMARVLGMSDNADGFLTSGGTLGNLTALLAARKCSTEYNLNHEGQKRDLKPVVMMSDEVHYSINKALKIMGWGEDATIKVPVDDHFRLQPEHLEKSYAQAQDSGRTPIAVVGNACSTATGSYDPLEEIADFCAQYKLWFHVDGAHGGPAAFSDSYKHLVAGIDRADSVIIDFHKMMMMPSLITAVIFKKGDDSYKTFSQHASYLWEKADDREWFNLTRRTFECTKDMMSIKIYSIFRFFGIELFSDMVTTLYDKGSQFAQLITEHPSFELAVNPSANIVCYRFNPGNLNESQLNQLNSHIRQTIIEQGHFHIVQTTIKDKVFLRSALMNPFTTEKEMNRLLDMINGIGAQFISDR